MTLWGVSELHSNFTAQLKYRDRAKERRDKFGTPAVIPGWKKRLERELVKDPIP